MINDFFIGIDPGKNGGIAGLTNGKITTLDKMPQTPTDMWGYFIDLGFPNLLEREKTHVYIESVHSMPTDGVKSAFSFGKHLGWFDMLFAKFNISPTLILPRVWQQHYDLKRSREQSKYNYKKELVEKAKSLVPKYQTKEITLKTADAYLIAKYGWETYNKEIK